MLVTKRHVPGPFVEVELIKAWVREAATGSSEKYRGCRSCKLWYAEDCDS